jgi:hypothetical protein
MSKIIAFAGRKQSGKSTGSQYIQSVIGSRNPDLIYREYSFADPLKQDICINILGLSYDQCYGSDDDKNTSTDLEWDGEILSARKSMEIIGTDIFRKLKNNVWVDATINKIKRENPDLAIIPDCRFPNEVESLKRMGGYVIRLDLDPFHSESPSESALDPDKYDWNNFDLIINNSFMSIDQKNEYILEFLLDKQII